MPMLEQPSLGQPSEVLRQFCHGDLDAFEALFRQHQGAVYGWIVRIVRDPPPLKTSPSKPSGVFTARMPALIRNAASRRGRDASQPMLRSITCERRGMTPNFPTIWHRHQRRTPVSPAHCAGRQRARSSGFRRSFGLLPRWR